MDEEAQNWSALSLDRRPPPVFWAYIGGTALVGAMGLLPSSVHTVYTWWGISIEIALLYGMFRGSNSSRLLLIVLGVAMAVGGMLVQATPFEMTATVVCVLTLMTTGLLLTRPMRLYTKDHRALAS